MRLQTTDYWSRECGTCGTGSGVPVHPFRYEHHSRVSSSAVSDSLRCRLASSAEQQQLPLSQSAESIIPTFPHRIIFTEDNEYYSSPMSECSCKLRTWARQYTGIHWAFQGVHGSQEPGCDKHGVNDTYWHSIIPHTGAIVTINVGLAQARPNNWLK